MSTLRHSGTRESEIAKESLITCFSLMTEALRRTLDVELYDVQLRAGLALSRESIAEMQTGEGKTLSAALAACAFALYGKGVHVMTVNAYLAERDYEILLPAFELLGVSAGVLRSDASPEQKRDAYVRDVTYGPGYEFGFDYLRDQLNFVDRSRRRLGDSYRDRLRGRGTAVKRTLQRGHAYAIIDEADSVMIDEATTPLILSGASSDSPCSKLYVSAVELAEQLELGRDYLFDARSRRIQLTNDGMDRTNKAANANTMVGAQHPWALYVENALRAKLLLQRDVDYVIQDQQVMLVDQRTGRIFADRSWRDGLRQAVEAREGVPVTAENQSMARISRQRFLRLYTGLCGLTGTAKGVEREYRQVYQLPVVTVPLRTPSRRRVLPTRFFVDKMAKWSAIVDEVRAIHRTGQPVLVGTRTIQDSTRLAGKLDQVGVPFRLLNGRQDADEAEVVALAGQVGAVTVATNMAGRGTDIKLGSGVPDLGGLHVIACEPHESTRVDRQLIGRCARQGDPGSCRLFASAEDELIADHGPLLAHRMARSGDPSGEIQVDLTSELARLQRRMERRAFAVRRQLFARDHWLEEVVTKYAGKTSS
jgi:preprotein translocase subunit SecA